MQYIRLLVMHVKYPEIFICLVWLQAELIKRASAYQVTGDFHARWCVLFARPSLIYPTSADFSVALCFGRRMTYSNTWRPRNFCFQGIPYGKERRLVVEIGRCYYVTPRITSLTTSYLLAKNTLLQCSLA